MQRITIKDLQAVCNRLNRETSSPQAKADSLFISK